MHVNLAQGQQTSLNLAIIEFVPLVYSVQLIQCFI